MKIGICSDTHGEPLPEFPTDCEIILHAGDLYDFDDLHDSIKATKIVEQVTTRKVVFVRGNHDITDRMKIMATCDISGKLARLGNIWVVGLGLGCGHRDGRKIEVMIPTEGGLIGICSQLLGLATENMKDGDSSILLTHYPARLPGEKVNEGFYFDCVFKVCQALRPLVVVQGHTHRDFGKVIEYDGMTFVWPGPAGKVLELSSSGIKIIPVIKITDRRIR
jgi:predicted phosphodiesterase